MNKLIATGLTIATMAFPALALASVDITLTGGSVSFQAGDVYSEPGYSALSTTDGVVTGSVVTSNNINQMMAGTYSVNYNVTDSALDSDSEVRSVSVYNVPEVSVSGGSSGAQPFCSSPMAPGWNVSLPGGGCGGTATFLLPGQEDCPTWYFMGCVKN